MIPTPASATWSIILVDTRTKEIAVGSATCLENFDLARWLPVVRVGRGAACAQASVDSGASNRTFIWNQLTFGVDPNEILAQLASRDPQHQSRQYGIVDVLGRAVTFTGTQTFAWAGGVTGQQGTMVYAIQGNILTGEPVVSMTEQAVLNTPGDLPEKLMAAMEAARLMGGDGRCSCPGNPTGCGAPPPSFTKSAHVGFMIDARFGEGDGNCNLTVGCATGNYHMRLNVAFQFAPDPDPVIQLRALFDAWRQFNIGRPDHYVSTVALDPPSIPADGRSTSTMTVTLRDYLGTQRSSGVQTFAVIHEAGSARSTTIGMPVNNGDGTYTVPLTAGLVPGTDVFRVITHDGVRIVVLMPSPTLELIPRPGDIDGDGDLDDDDINLFVTVLLGIDTGNPAHVIRSDVNHSGAADGEDVPALTDAFLNP